MIVFNKRGRKTKQEKTLLSKIGDIFSSLSEDEQNKLKSKSYQSRTELEEIYESIKDIEPIKKEPIMASNTDIEDAEEVVESTKPFSESNEGAIPDFFSPLTEEDVKQRSYNKTATLDFEIEEPTFQNNIPEEALNNDVESGQDQAPSPFENITNPAVNQLEGKEKKMAVESLVDAALDGYAFLHDIGKKFAQFDENKLMKKIASGEIDPSMELELSEGATMNPVEFVQTYNQQVDEVISYDPEFGKKVRPAMIRVFEKKGWGISDEQYLMYMFGKDLAVKTSLVIGMKKSTNMVLSAFAEMKATQMKAERDYRKENPPVRPDRVQHAEPQVSAEPPIKEDIEDVDIDTDKLESKLES